MRWARCNFLSIPSTTAAYHAQLKSNLRCTHLIRQACGLPPSPRGEGLLVRSSKQLALCPPHPSATQTPSPQGEGFLVRSPLPLAGKGHLAPPWQEIPHQYRIYFDTVSSPPSGTITKTSAPPHVLHSIRHPSLPDANKRWFFVFSVFLCHNSGHENRALHPIKTEVKNQ